MTSAEWAAMVDHHILPELRKCYPNDGPEFDALCQKFAKRIGVPDKWRDIALPSFISWDNASVHAHARKLLCAPRVPWADINAYVNTRIKEEFNIDTPAGYEPATPKPPPRAPAPPPEGTVMRGMAATLRAGRRARPERQRERTPEAEREERRQAAQRQRAFEAECIKIDAELLKWEQDHGASFVDVCKREMAKTQPAMRCIFPQQWMPLIRVTPDIHSPVEHMVGTIKRYIKMKIRENLGAANSMLFKAKTYQDWVLEAVEKRGNGESGRRHIKRSVDKQKCICQLLAAKTTEDVELHYVFMGDDNEVGNKRSVWKMKGFAGNWITNSRWT